MDQLSHSIKISVSMDDLMYNIIIYFLIFMGGLYIVRELVLGYYKIIEMIHKRREANNGTNR